MIDFISQVLHLRFGNAVFEHTVEIVICAVVMSCIGTKTVSYTHLDVYKRQSLSNILSDSGVFLIHRSLAGDESHYAARTELVQGLGEEVVVNEELVLVVTLVRNFEIPEGYIPHNLSLIHISTLPRVFHS